MTMGAFILAALIFIGATALAFVWGFGEGMATAPVYDSTPRNIFIGGIVLALLIASSHWFPPIGW